jgi:hypothetical protein
LFSRSLFPLERERLIHLGRVYHLHQEEHSGTFGDSSEIFWNVTL